MQISRQVERSLLRRVENNTLGQTMVLLQRNAKTERPHVPTHADDVIVLFRRVDGIGLAVVDLPCEFAKKRRCGERAKRKSLVITAGPQGFRTKCRANSGGLE